MQKFIDKIGWGVFWDLVAYISIVILYSYVMYTDWMFVGLALLFIIYVAFFLGILFGVTSIILSKKKNVKLKKSMELFQQGIWGVLLAVPWLLYQLVIWMLPK